MQRLSQQISAAMPPTATETRRNNRPIKLNASNLGSMRLLGFIAALTVVGILAGSVDAQESQFLFDANGNLQARTTEVGGLPQILAQPQAQVSIPGEAASFSVVAADTTGLNYQWCFAGTNLPGAIADSLLVTNVSMINQGLYTVILSNGSGNVTSAPAMLWIDSVAACPIPGNSSILAT